MELLSQPDVIETVQLCVVWFAAGYAARAAQDRKFRRWFSEPPVHHEGTKDAKAGGFYE